MGKFVESFLVLHELQQFAPETPDLLNSMHEVAASIEAGPQKVCNPVDLSSVGSETVLPIYRIHGSIQHQSLFIAVLRLSYEIVAISCISHFCGSYCMQDVVHKIMLPHMFGFTIGLAF